MQTATKANTRTASVASGRTVNILAFGGDISSASKDMILGACHSLNRAARNVLLDFTGVDSIDSSGIANVIRMLLGDGLTGWLCKLSIG